MKSILATTLLVSTALATPLSLQPDILSTNSTIRTRQVGKGTDSGISISMYTKKDCQGDGLKDVEMMYSTTYPQQMRSYHLSDTLGSDDVLGFWADVDWLATGSKPVDPSLNGNQEACATFVYNAVDPKTKKGCHTLSNVVGCVTIEINESPK